MDRQHLYKLRELIRKAAEYLNDNDALSGVELFEPWKIDTAYIADQRIRYGDKLYRCNQSHTSQASWAPDLAPALWSEIADPSIEWPQWHQPQGAHDAYALGAKVSYDERHWISTIDANVYIPGVYGWEEQP